MEGCSEEDERHGQNTLEKNLALRTLRMLLQTKCERLWSVKTTPHTSIFAVCLQEILVQIKGE